MNLMTVVNNIHLAAGCVSLLTFTIPMFAPKGGRIHRTVGWIFVSAIGVLCVTGVPMTLVSLAAEQTSEGQARRAFLLLLTLLSGASTWKGIRVLRFKGAERHSHLGDLGVSLCLMMCGAVIAVLGLQFRSGLLGFFGVGSVLVGLHDFRYWRNPAKGRMHWFFEHMGGMIGSSVGALTAFSALGGRRFGLAPFGMLSWILPSVVMGVIAVVWIGYYRRRFDARRDPTAAPSGPATPTVFQSEAMAEQ